MSDPGHPASAQQRVLVPGGVPSERGCQKHKPLEVGAAPPGPSAVHTGLESRTPVAWTPVETTGLDLLSLQAPSIPLFIVLNPRSLHQPDKAFLLCR